jgi:hypothetical protein
LCAKKDPSGIKYGDPNPGGVYTNSAQKILENNNLKTLRDARAAVFWSQDLMADSQDDVHLMTLIGGIDGAVFQNSSEYTRR